MFQDNNVTMENYHFLEVVYREENGREDFLMSQGTNRLMLLITGPFIEEKISQGICYGRGRLHKTQTPSVKMVQNLRSRLIQSTARSTRGLSWPRRFGLGLSKPRLTLDVKVFVNALKRCPRLAEAVNDCCACSIFNYIRDQRRALQWRESDLLHRRAEISSKLHFIHRRNISSKTLD